MTKPISNTLANVPTLQEEERWTAYAKAKIATGLEDIAAGRTISQEEFIAEIKARHHPTSPK
jgi:predicted transcriptional regulator